MAIFEQLPYTNFHELNLDWIIEKLQDLDERLIALEEEVNNNNGDI